MRLHVKCRDLARCSLFAAAGLLLLLPAACGQLPRPFQPPAKAVDLKQLNHEASIVLLPVTGVPASPGFSERLVTALQEHGLRATTEPNGGANRLQVAANILPLGEGVEVVLLDFSLSDAEGEEIATLEERWTLGEGLWESAPPESFSEIAQRSAKALALQINGDDTQLAEVTRGRVVVMPVVSPGGSVDEVLTGAIKAQLRRRGIALAGVPGPRDVTVEGAVSLDTLEPGWQRVALVWRVVDVANGDELGTVDQSNRIPEGSVDGGFGSSSSLVASGAAEGISQILEVLEIDYFK